MLTPSMERGEKVNNIHTFFIYFLSSIWFSLFLSVSFNSHLYIYRSVLIISTCFELFSICFFQFTSVYISVFYQFLYVYNCIHLVLSVFHLTFSNVPLGQVHFIQHMLVRCSTRVESLPQPFQTWNYFENFLFLLKDSLIFILYSVASLKLLSEQIKPVSYFSFGQFKETFP